MQIFPKGVPCVTEYNIVWSEVTAQDFKFGIKECKSVQNVDISYEFLPCI